MGSFTGTGANDTITNVEVSPGVTRNPGTPPNARPNAEGDFVSGGSGSDLIAGVGGNDDLRGDDGNDTIDGGADNDGLTGGLGNDVLIGGSGNDFLVGGDGIDTYTFGRSWGVDFLRPGATTGRDIIEFLDTVDRTKVQFRVENDDLIIFQGANSIFVENQFISGVGASTPVREVKFATGPVLDISRPLDVWLNRVGTNSNDSFTTSIFDDTIDARGGDDGISGNTGNDVLTGGKGNDNIAGGDGNDLFRFDTGFGVDNLTEFAGQGRDTIEFGTGIRLVDLNLFVQNSSLIVQQGKNQITLSNQFASGQSANAAFETIKAGTALLDIRKVDDDWLIRTGKNAAESFTGSLFKDTIDGGGGNDFISTIDGNDVITGGKGNDDLRGGLGNDRYVFETGFGVDFITEFFNSGKDVIAFGLGFTAADLDFRIDNGSTLTISRGASSITINGQFSSGTGANVLVETIELNSGATISLKKPEADWLIRTGTNGNDFFSGSNFGDTIDARGGNDDVRGGTGRDSLEGNTGDDFLLGGIDNDTLSGSAGNDSMRAEDGNDSLSGGAGLDTLDAGTGRDTLEGGAGNDTMTGGTESDLFVFRQGDGIDFVNDFVPQDKMQFIGFGPNFNTPQKLFNAAFQAGDDVIVEIQTQGNPLVRVTLLDVNLDRLDADNFLV